MNETLGKKERLSRAIAGAEVDRLPFSLWRHFYAEETAAEPLVRRLAEWHRRFDFDFVKVNVRAQYHTEGWGGQYAYSGEDDVSPRTVKLGVTRPRDFTSLSHLDPWSWPLGEMLQVISGLRRELGPEEILVMTIFNPMSVAMDLVGGPEQLAAAIAADARSVHQGLRAITDTFRDFTTQCLEQGADGIFLATTKTASAANFTREQYEEFGRPYDLEVLEAADRAFLNILHVCGPQAYVRDLLDYPVQALSWDTNDASNPTLGALRGPTAGKALIGGLSRELFTRPDGAKALLDELLAAQAMMAGLPFVVGSSCTIATESLEANIDAVCEALRG
jgi:uroporphyrinogen decarboxylase